MLLLACHLSAEFNVNDKGGFPDHPQYVLHITPSCLSDRWSVGLVCHSDADAFCLFCVCLCPGSRGFETVTYIFPSSTGSFQHEDFVGNKGTIGPGDLQWVCGMQHCAWGGMF